LTGALLAHHGRSLNAVFGSDDNAALGALDAALQAKRDDLLIVGYSGAPETPLPPTAAAHLLTVKTIPRPGEIGRAAIETIARYLKGDKDIPKTVPVPYAVVGP
jgi:ABC-type sugar transport system substrate-binding protein